MGFSNFFRVLLQVIATFLLFGAIVLSVVALVTPAWQTVTLGSGEVHQHGLWLTCQKGAKRALVSNVDPSEWNCDYKFDDKPLTGPDPHKLLNWHITVIALLAVAALIGMIALIFSFCAPWYNWSAVIWVILSFISTGLSVTATVIFFKNSHERDYLYVEPLPDPNTYKQFKGYSFWCCVGGGLAFLLASIISVVATILIIAHSKRERYYDRTWPKNNTMHNTAV